MLAVLSRHLWLLDPFEPDYSENTLGGGPGHDVSYHDAIANMVTEAPAADDSLFSLFGNGTHPLGDKQEVDGADDDEGVNLRLLVSVIAFTVVLLCAVYGLAVTDRFFFCCPGYCDELEAAMADPTPEQSKEQRTQKARMERRLWYQYYLKAYTTIVTMEDLWKCSSDTASDTSDETAPPPSPTGLSDVENQLNDTREQEEDSDGVNLDQVDSGPGISVILEIPSDSHRDEGNGLGKTLFQQHPRRRINDTQCAICINDYEVGDKVVHSSLVAPPPVSDDKDTTKTGSDSNENADVNQQQQKCPHVFHHDCMLDWLCHQGRKRCPICRHWFVPGLYIKDQMKLANVKISQDGHHLVDANDEGRILSTISFDNDGCTHGGDTDERKSIATMQEDEDEQQQEQEQQQQQEEGTA